MFQGASSLSLDAKGRLSVPTRHRDVLSATAAGQLTITRHPHGCLMVFPRPEWEKFRERIAALPMSAQWWKRIFLGNAMDVEMDGTGRVLISPELRTRDRERKLLKKIEQSIQRIDAGDYGYCDETGEAIGVGRLLARPTASLSLEAQERREIKQRMFGD